MVCRRDFRVAIGEPAASRERLTTYLALVDRPLTSLLARERLSLAGPGQLIYRSNPIRLLHLEVVPTLCLAAEWKESGLALRSTRCRLAGLGAWAGNVGFTLRASMEPAEGAVSGWAEVAVQSRMVRFQGARGMARLALEHVLDRIERRLERGFQRDVVAWLGRGADRTVSGG